MIEKCDDPDCLVCPIAAVVERMQVAGIKDTEILERTLQIVGDILGFETAVLEGESGSIH
jgi:hypothetical protein